MYVRIYNKLLKLKNIKWERFLYILSEYKFINIYFYELIIWIKYFLKFFYLKYIIIIFFICLNIYDSRYRFFELSLLFVIFDCDEVLKFFLIFFVVVNKRKRLFLIDFFFDIWRKYIIYV